MVDGLIPYLEQILPDCLLHPFDDLIALLHFPVYRLVEADRAVRELLRQGEAEIQEFQNIGGVPVLIGTDEIRDGDVQNDAHMIDMPWL